jgi:glycosyltransferase involved in cell wall biosynthesis
LQSNSDELKPSGGLNTGCHHLQRNVRAMITSPHVPSVRAFFASYPLHAHLEPADVYHITAQTMATLLWMQSFPAPVVVTVLDIIPYLVRHSRDLNPFRHIVDRWFYRLALAGLHRAHALVAISAWTRQTLGDALGIPLERVYVVYPALDHDKFRPMAVPDKFRLRYGLNAETQYILYVGSDDPRKNLSTLLKAFALLKRQVSDVKLLKVGEPHFVEARKRLSMLIETLGIQNDVVFFDYVADDVLPLFYNVADVLAFPSLYEGFGLPLVEAMACGTPVICSDTEVFREVAGNAALFIDARDVEMWAAVLADFLEGKRALDVLQESGSLSDRGRQRVQVLTQEAEAQTMLAVYQRYAWDIG